jgi:hypothetical protein
MFNNVLRIVLAMALLSSLSYGGAGWISTGGGGGVTPNSCDPGEFAEGILSNGTLQCTAPSAGGVTTVGAFSGSSQTNGASISGSTVTFGPADATNPGMLTTGTQTIAGAKTFSNNIAITPTANYSEVSNSTGLAKISLGNNSGQRSVNFCPSGTCANNESLSVWSYDGTPAFGNGGPFMSIHPVLLFFRQGSDTPSGSTIRSLSNFSGGNSMTDQNWLGGEWSTFQRITPWYGAGLNFIAMGYEHFDTAPTPVQGQIKVETGTNFSIEADKGLFNGYVFSAGEHNAAACTTTKTISWADQSAQKVDMEGNCTFTLTNPVAGGSYVLKLVQDGTGGRTYTWPSNVKWSGGTAPTASGANKLDLVNLYYDGTNYYGGYSLNYTP